MTLSHQAVLLLSFGGPEAPGEIRPFLERVLRGIPVPPGRVEEVVHHYEAVGGRSPLKEITLRQADALEKTLKEHGLPLPVYVGMRHSGPFIREALDAMQSTGVKRALGFILSAQRTEASWDRYQKNVADAQRELAGRAPEIDYCPGWHAHPLFIQAWSELIQSRLEQSKNQDRRAIPLVFTAHSIPTAMAAGSPYVDQVQQTAQLIAERLGQRRWSIAYQSRSGRPSEPWLEPDITEEIRALAQKGEKEIVVAPIGFVCDHVEVLYDLDIEARKIAEELGMGFLRASCVNDHPTFIRMMADVIQNRPSAHPNESR